MFLDKLECVNMCTVYIQVSIGRKLNCLLLPGLPLMERGKELTSYSNQYNVASP
jgi:hypothetical protein